MELLYPLRLLSPDHDAWMNSTGFARWRDAVEPLMQEPRSRILYQNIQPADEGWG